MGYEWHDVVGNVGVAAILLTYLLVQTDRLDARRLSYSVLNAVGAGLITISLIFEFNLSAFIVELCWFVMSCYGILRRVGALGR